jgi:hypothetical protein
MKALRFCQKTAPILSVSGNPNTPNLIKSLGKIRAKSIVQE